jgi:iron complex transport system ATP-binding protein
MIRARGDAMEAGGLAVQALEVRLGGRSVLQGLELGRLRRGEIVAVVGPNAAGKSTLFKALAGLVRKRGRVLLDGVDLAALPPRDRARRIGFLPQDLPNSAVLTVFEAVLLAVKQDGAWSVEPADLARVERVLAAAGISRSSGRWLGELSGGQRQMVALAQVLVREPDLLLLDEPTSALDLQHQLDLLQLVQDHVRAHGAIALAALHDLNLAARFADRVAVVHDGQVVAQGAAEAVLTADLLARVYGVEAAIGRDAAGHLVVTPLRSLRRSDG